MFYIGGTKNGLPYGELLVIINDELKTNFKYLLKNKLGMLAKGFVGAIMFKFYLKNDYYLTLAKNSLEQSNILREKLDKYLIYKNKTNQIYIKLKKNDVNKLSSYVDFEIWENIGEYQVIRLVTAFNTTKDEVSALVEVFKNLNLI